jgi:hypothetical protein
VARISQLRPQRAEVVHLAVEHGTDRAVLVGHRRIARDEVDDREAILRDDRDGLFEAALGVRPPVVQTPKLLADDRGGATGPADAARDAAHRLSV